MDIVFEAMVENMALKKEAFAKMAPIIKPEAIFVSNTDVYKRQVLLSSKLAELLWLS